MPIGRIGHYEVLEKLGQGSMGLVFKARDVGLDRLIALKILSRSLMDSREARLRFQREARAEASLSHPNIAVCYEIAEGCPDPPDLLGDEGCESGDPVLYLAMEYVSGQDLAATVSGRKHRLTEILRLALQIVSGLEEAHRSGVVHRDLKPSNIFVSDQCVVKILDFGLAKVLFDGGESGPEPLPSLSSDGRVIGTAAYMSPEQATGDPVDQRSDLFSFGIVLYEMITGRLPFTGSSFLESLRARLHEDAAPLARYAAGIPDELERIIRKLLSRDLAARYQSAHEVATDLDDLIRRLESGVHRVPRQPRWKGRLQGAALAVVALLAVWFGSRSLRGAGHGPERTTLAVLPFSNLTGDKDLDYISDGVAAGVLNEIVQRTDYNVVSQSVAWSYRGDTRMLADISHELGVGTVLEGSLHGRPEGVRMNVRLVNAHSGLVIWSQTFDSARDGIQNLEEEIASRVVQGLSGGEARLDPVPWTPSPAAYELSLRAGRFLDDADDPRGPDSALALYSSAVRLDPNFALAHAGRSKALWRLYARDRIPGQLEEAEQAAERAVDIRPDLLEARLARAQTYRGTGRYDLAIAELLKVLAVNPNWDEAHLQLAAAYRDAGRLQDAEAAGRRALALRPDYWRNWNWLGALLIKTGDLDGAAEAFRSVIRLLPGRNRGYEQLAAVNLVRGRFEDAVALYDKLPAPVADGALASNVGTAYFFSGELDKAETFYRMAVEFEPRNQVCLLNLGDLLVRRGRTDEARRDYGAALDLVDGILVSEPQNLEIRTQRVVLLAKLGRCEEARTECVGVEAHRPADDAECAHTLARAHALCGDRAGALAELGSALRLGVSVDYVRREDEFAELRNDPGFRALITAK